jgi:Mg-chelatase subunit ChlD
MKNVLAPAVLFVVTAVAVYIYPDVRTALAGVEPRLHVPIQSPMLTVVPNARPKIEVVFVLDTTGSMGGLIQAAKEKIWSIATNMAQAQHAPEIKMGLVAYRDRGDAYVTQVVDLSADLDSMYGQLMSFQAAGGGDGPESVNQALHDAVSKIAWSQDSSAYKVVFLVGDAPPHMDYQDDVKYQDSVKSAGQKGIVINTIQCGADAATTQPWQQIARLGQGRYVQVEQSGSAVAISTPYDAKLADLAAQIDATRLPYGSVAEKRKAESKYAASAKIHTQSSVESQARRALFNSTASGKDNFTGEKELVDDVTSGRTDISKIDREALPATLRSLAPAEQKAALAETAGKRQDLQKQIEDLGRQRAEYVKDKIDKPGAAKGSLDEKLFGVVREQATKKGLNFKSATPVY